MKVPLIPQTDMAVVFLKAMFPNQRRHLISIGENTPTEAASFDPDDEDAMRDWIEARQGKQNLYFHVNGLKPGVRNKKATKADVAAAHFLHADLDDLDALDRIRS